MSKKSFEIVTVKLDKIVGGGQVIGTLEDGHKIFVWGGLPGETAMVQITKRKSKLSEGVVVEVIEPSLERVEPRDPDNFLSTSPWQIMNYKSEQKYKAELIKEAYELHGVNLPNPIEIYTDNEQYGYRNKVEFSWYWNKDTDQLDLAFFKRGSHEKIAVEGSDLAKPEINRAAIATRNLLRQKVVRASHLKTLLVRCDNTGNVAMQLYVKEPDFVKYTDDEINSLGASGFEVIYSNPNSPASVITKRLASFGDIKLTDTVLGVPFSYTPESFFQINLPVYEQSLWDIKKWVDSDKPLMDLYSGVGTIGLTTGSKKATLVEIDEHAYAEMITNVKNLGRDHEVKTVLSPSEKVLDFIDNNSIIIVDPPRAGLHRDVIEKILETMPEKIIYLSCNPVTQARDIAMLSEKYDIIFHRGYNFFPKTPHIENLAILSSRDN